MHILTRIGRIIFATGIIALGVLSIIVKDFIIGRPPAGTTGFNNPALVYFSATAVIIAALLILLQKKIRTAALVIALLILAFSVSRHALSGFADWLNTYKALALAGGALIIGYSSGQPSKDISVWAGRILLAVFFIAGGYAHFKFAGFVESFIPDYIPFRNFWAYFCGICLIAGGIGILIPQTVKWAALLSGIMIAGWFVLLHIPRFLNNPNDASDRMGLLESFTFAGIFFVLAGIFSRKNN